MTYFAVLRLNIFYFRAQKNAPGSNQRRNLVRHYAGGAERGIWTLAPVSRPTPLAGEPLHHLGISAWRIIKYLIGAADRTWTDTVLLPRDFKSLVSADSTTAAFGCVGCVGWLTLIYYTLISPACQVLFENFIKLFSLFSSCILLRNSVKYL